MIIHGHIPDSKVHGANMGPIWGRQNPGRPHVGPMNFVIWDYAMKALSAKFTIYSLSVKSEGIPPRED